MTYNKNVNNGMYIRACTTLLELEITCGLDVKQSSNENNI